LALVVLMTSPYSVPAPKIRSDNGVAARGLGSLDDFQQVSKRSNFYGTKRSDDEPESSPIADPVGTPPIASAPVSSPLKGGLALLVTRPVAAFRSSEGAWNRGDVFKRSFGQTKRSLYKRSAEEDVQRRLQAILKRANEYVTKRMEAPPIAEAQMAIGFRGVPVRRQAAPIVVDQEPELRGYGEAKRMADVTKRQLLARHANREAARSSERQVLITRLPFRPQAVAPVVPHQPVLDRAHPVPVRTLLY